jgi:hypothetical protein
MWKAILQHVKATFPAMMALLISMTIVSTLNSQQNVIANKDNTRPEASRQISSPPIISLFSAKKYNGYNEVLWNASADQDARKFIVEYSYDGIDFLSAGEALSTNGAYSLKHYTPFTRPLLYRIRTEDKSGKFYYSGNILLDGQDILPVKVYPTVVTGNVINLNADFSIERVAIVSSEGLQVFAKDLNGVRDFIPITIPSLNKGVYLITFYGNGWKNTQKFIVG